MTHAEQPTDLLFWIRDGSCGAYRARMPANTTVSIGRTNSKRALGFVVTRGEVSLDFVLNQDQVIELAGYLRMMAPALLKPQGRKPEQISFVAMADTVERRRRHRRKRKTRRKRSRSRGP
jgi:hypothetical protein